MRGKPSNDKPVKADVLFLRHWALLFSEYDRNCGLKLIHKLVAFLHLFDRMIVISFATYFSVQNSNFNQLFNELNDYNK